MHSLIIFGRAFISRVVVCQFFANLKILFVTNKVAELICVRIMRLSDASSIHFNKNFPASILHSVCQHNREYFNANVFRFEVNAFNKFITSTPVKLPTPK